MHVCVLGAGVAGLAAARHLADPRNSFFTFTLFEQSSQMGGTWVYTEQVGTDKHSLPVHSSMYKNLRTNLPKEIMRYPDYQHTKYEGISYLRSCDVLQYLKDYAEHFSLKRHMKLEHYVKNVAPQGKKWEVTVTDLATNHEKIFIFDAIIISNGYCTTPNIPRVKGVEQFLGIQLHSHEYRKPDSFGGKSVLIIGAGPSGLDMAFDLAVTAHLVIVSHHSNYVHKVQFPENVITKPDVDYVTHYSAIFKDGSTEQVDVILYCTGYLYSYPFLSEACSITVEDNFVQPLYKHMVNIIHPTMCIISILKHTVTFHLPDAQVKYFLAMLQGNVSIPSQDEMLLELQSEIGAKLSRGTRLRDFHVLGTDSEAYLNELAMLGHFEPVSPLVLRIYFYAYDRIYNDFKNFRNSLYRIIDSETFSVLDLSDDKNNKSKTFHLHSDNMKSLRSA